MKKSKLPIRVITLFISVLISISMFTMSAFAKADAPVENEPSNTLEETKKDVLPDASVPLTHEGNMTVVDDLEGEQTEDKQFITVKTKSGNTFYLIIDRAGKENNVYFLNLVDEADLMALMKKDGTLNQLPDEGMVPAETTPKPEPSPEPGEKLEPIEKKQSKSPLLLILIFLLAAGGAGFMFFKYRNPKQNIKGSTDLDEYFFEDDDDEETYVNEDDVDLEGDEE